VTQTTNDRTLSIALGSLCSRVYLAAVRPGTGDSHFPRRT